MIELRVAYHQIANISICAQGKREHRYIDSLSILCYNINMKFREFDLPTNTNYASLDEVPENTMQILDIYDTIEHYISQNGAMGVNEVLDEFMGQQCYIAEEDDLDDELDVLAVSSYRKEMKEGYAWLEALAVRPDLRGSGVGSYVIDRLVEVSRDSGLAEIRLASEPTAVPFYQRNGFVIIDSKVVNKRPQMVRDIV